MDQNGSKWICAREFTGKPLNVFKREMEPDSEEVKNHPENCRNYHAMVRKVFVLEDVPEKLILQITADDYYKVYVNGIFAGQGPAPAYAENYRYNEYDITSLAGCGKNVIAVHCYYQGLVNRVWNSADMRQGIRAEVYGDGKLLFGTDNTWRYKKAEEYTAAGITGYDTQYMENIDARKMQRGWKCTDYDDSGWEQACVKEADDHQLHLQETKPLCVYEQSAQTVTDFGDGSFLLDFGKEITACIRLRTKGEEGEQVRILAGEELQEDGHVRYRMRSNCDYEEVWTLSGEEDEIENYDYKVLRYLEICSGNGHVKPSQVTAVVRHYPFENPTRLTDCSDSRLLKVWEICSRGVMLGSQEVFVDCPGREKGQYLGDMVITARNHLYLTGEEDMFRKGLYDFAAGAKVDPGLMAVAPGSLMQEIADFSLMFPYLVFRYYCYTRDRKTMEDMYPVIADMLEHFRQYQREDGLLAYVKDKWNLVDWPENLRDSYDFPLTRPVGPGCHNVINAYYYGALSYTSEIEEALGMDSRRRRKEAQRIKQSYQKAFFDREQGVFCDREGSKHASLHGNGIPLFFGLQPEGSEDAVTALIKKKGLCCGVYTAYYILKGLAGIGRYQDMYDLMMNEGEHSWMNMIREGATACYEAWGKDQKWNTSLCHPWGSGPILLVLEEIIGITWHKGMKAPKLNPHLPKQIDHISLLFKAEGRMWEIQADPAGASCREAVCG